MKRNIPFILGLLLAIFFFELIFKFRTNFPSPLTDNNSFIIKKNVLRDYLKTHDDKLEGMNVFVGSSFFARGIECSLMENFPCLNLSMDGGDALSYRETFERLLKGRRAKRIIFELTQIIFAKYDYSGPAVKGYLDTPVDHLKTYASEGLTPGFKQALKNQVDALLLWSGLNFYSRRNRFTDWPLLALTRFGGPSPQNKVTFFPEISTYFSPELRKIELFLSLIDEIKAEGTEVVVVATPEKYEGEFDSQKLVQSRVYRLMNELERENRIHFVHDLTKSGLPPDSFADELNHLSPDRKKDLATVLRRTIEAAP